MNLMKPVDNLQRSFNETHVEVFHFGVDLEELKKSNIADIFARACNRSTD